MNLWFYLHSTHVIESERDSIDQSGGRYFVDWGYMAWFLGHMVLIHQYVEGGEGVLLVLGVAVAMSDVGAYAMGKTFGKHRLSPRRSPNKTVEGALGNLIGAYAGVIVMAYAIPPDTNSMMPVVLPVLIGATYIWGDRL